MDRDDYDLRNCSSDWDGLSPPSDKHRSWFLLVHHLEQVLALYDALDEGDSESAANAQRSLDEAKKILRAGAHDDIPTAKPPTSATILPFPSADLDQHQNPDTDDE